jgi:HSP20 family protein
VKGGSMANAMTRWHPFEDLADLRERFDKLLGDFAGDFRPAIDVVRKNGSIVVRADVPGMKPEEIAIEVKDDILTISGEHEETTEDKDEEERVVRSERHFGSFSRSIALPPEVGAEDITATCHDGVLEVSIPAPPAADREPVKIVPTAS